MYICTLKVKWCSNTLVEIHSVPRLVCKILHECTRIISSPWRTLSHSLKISSETKEARTHLRQQRAACVTSRLAYFKVGAAASEEIERRYHCPIFS